MSTTFVMARAAALSVLPLAAFTFTAGPAQAQTGASDGALEEIVVTAQRREQNIQDVPMAISAFSEADLEALQANNLDSLQGAVPNMNLVRGRGSNSSVNAYIRGVGQPDALQTFDPAVGVYIDDVYMARIQGSLFKLYGVERVEVLRGPQGTLYGKNTPGGAIKLVTKQPGDSFEGQAGVLVGDYDRLQFKGYLAGPVSENFRLGFSVLSDRRDGFVTDPATGIEYNDEDTLVARLRGVWDVSDAVTFDFSIDGTREDVEKTLGRLEAPLISIDFVDGAVPRLPAPTGEWNFETRTSMTDQPGQEVDASGVHGAITWDINDTLRFRSITAYRQLETDFYIDIDASEFEIGDVFVGLDQDQVSQEFQLLGEAGNVNWIIGAYYLEEDVESDQTAFADDFLLFGGAPVSFLRTIVDDLKTESIAGFGQVDIAFGRWTLGIGGRYTREEKTYFRSTSTFSDVLGDADPAFAFSDDDSWDDFTPSVSLDYAASDDVRFYGRVARGFKSGGFNGRANSAPDVSTFDPETVVTAELGAKGTFGDGRVLANFAVFSSQYEDFQARVSIGDGIDFRFPVLNAAELDINGFEVEATVLATDALQLSTQIGYLDAEYGQGGFTGSDGVADQPAFSPEWTGRLAGTYTHTFGNGATLGFSVDANYRDAMWLSVENVEALRESDYWLLNGLVRYSPATGSWSLSAGIKNATDELYRIEGQEFRSVGNIQTAYYGDPRTWTIAAEFFF